MDAWFKVKYAQEEIKCLNIEIQYVITHLHDENKFLTVAKLRVTQTDAPLTFQIKQYCKGDLKNLGGSSKSLTCGQQVLSLQGLEL